jgi:hypothetical protein
MTAATITHLPQALTASDFGAQLSLRGNEPGRTVRRMFRDGKLPGPIDATLPAQSWRWSPAVVAAYINPTAAA